MHGGRELFVGGGSRRPWWVRLFLLLGGHWYVWWALVRLVGIGTFVSLYYYYILYTCRTRDVDVPTNCAARIKISDYH